MIAELAADDGEYIAVIGRIFSIILCMKTMGIITGKYAMSIVISTPID